MGILPEIAVRSSAIIARKRAMLSRTAVCDDRIDKR
jgi:hypothetical protein